MRDIVISGRKIGDNQPTFVIAEAGVNHDGNIELAYKLIDHAKEAGADAVKFQTFVPERYVRKDAEKPDYQKKTIPNETQYHMLKRLAFSVEDLQKAMEYGKKKGIIVFSTPYDEIAADDLEKIGVPAYKIASMEVVNHPFLEHMTRKKVPTILSTGLSTVKEIDEAVAIFRKNEALNKLILLHCHANYPTEVSDLNLSVIPEFKKRYDLIVGFSDHTPDIFIPSIAVSLGARVVEKHLTYNKKAKGPDHSSSVEPDELKEMIKLIRMTEKSLGSSVRKPSAVEIKNIVMRKSLVANRDIKKGEIIKRGMLAAKRPGSGLFPTYENISKMVGKKAKNDIIQDAFLIFKDLC